MTGLEWRGCQTSRCLGCQGILVKIVPGDIHLGTQMSYCPATVNFAVCTSHFEKRCKTGVYHRPYIRGLL